MGKKTKSSLKADLWKFHKVVKCWQTSSLLSEGLQSLSGNSASDQGIRFWFTFSSMQQKALSVRKTTMRKPFKQTEFGFNVERPGVRNAFLRERDSTSYHP